MAAVSQYLSRHPELLGHDENVAFLARELIRTAFGAACFAGTRVIGVHASPLLARAIFVLLPIFYGLMSEQLGNVPSR